MRFAHIADTHIRNLRYHKEYNEIFKQLYASLREENVDYIIHCGDIAHTKTQISPEFVDMCSDFLSNLADIAPTYVILGNHDGNLKNSGRLDALSPIVEALGHPDLHLLKDSQEVYLGGGFAINVLSVFDEQGWQDPSNYDNVNIAVYHGSISNCRTDNDWVMENGEHEIEIFEEFDYGFLGDIHKPQALDKKGKIRYPGSTVQQGFGESLDKGILIWDIKDRDNFEVRRVIFDNPKPFITIELQHGKLPDVEVQKGARVRLVSNESITLEDMKKAVDIAKHRHKPESITFLNRNIGQHSTSPLTSQALGHDDLRDIVVQRRLIKQFLEDYQLDIGTLTKVLELNDKYNLIAEEGEEVLRNVNWKIRKLTFDNLFNYGEDNSIDFTKLRGVVGVFGKNFSGKSSIIDGFLLTMFNTTSKNERKSVNVINFDKDYACGSLELLTEDGTLWNINRNLDKQTRRTKGQRVVTAKTDVEFTSTTIDGVTKVLNGTTRMETDKEIRRTFGTLDDFLLTSMSSQLDSLAFIREGSTKRKEIFAKFLDLELFDRKFKLAKKEASNLRGALKRLEGKEYAADIDEALHDLQQCILDHEGKQGELSSISQLILECGKLVQELQSAVRDTPTELINITQLRRDISEKREQSVALSNINDDLGSKIETSTEVIQTIEQYANECDIESLTRRIEKSAELKELAEDIEAQLLELNKVKARNERQAEVLSGIPCGTTFPTCKFIKNAYIAKSDIPSNEADIEALTTKKTECAEKEISFGGEEAQAELDRYNKLINKKKEHEAAIVRASLTISKNEALIANLGTQIGILEEREAQYLINKEAVDKLSDLVAEESKQSKRLAVLKTEEEDLDNEAKLLYKRLGSLEQKVENLREQQEELTRLQEEYSAYDLYLKCMHSNGIAYKIIKSKLPVINEEISKFLMNIVDFDIYFEDDGKRLNIHIQHPNQDPRPLEMGSGAEKTIAAMAIRLALLSVSNLPKGDVFILDEPGTALDEENMEGFTRMLDMIKSHFKTVMLISHLETLKDCVDTQISIEQKDGYAFVDC